MMRCTRCDVEFTGGITSCPLCGETLTGTPVPSPFPTIERQHASVVANRMLGVATAATLACIIVLALLFSAAPLNVLLAAVALILNYIFVRNLLLYKPNFLRTAQRYYLILMAMAFALFIATQSSALSTFVIPMLSIVGMVFDAVLLTAFRSRFIKAYAKYILFFIVLGCLPLFLLLTDTVSWPWLIYASAALAVLLFAALLIFARLPVKEEAKKLFDA